MTKVNFVLQHVFYDFKNLLVAASLQNCIATLRFLSSYRNQYTTKWL